jgi:PIN domain nuclease of toxin-antitoxin system
MQVSPDRLGAELPLVTDTDNDLRLSAASAWEISIKSALGKLALPVPPEEYVPTRMESSGVDPLFVTITHALRVSVLPLLHRDPFDRMIVAQAQVEGLPILTADPKLAAYDVEVIMAG